MTYSTCTINPEENEAMVRYALDTYPCLRLIPAEPRIGGPGACVLRDACCVFVCGWVGLCVRICVSVCVCVSFRAGLLDQKRSC
jgi:16S rRNA C967 or C1407 C5-methylase (RsmB/RsmF family)